MTDRELMQQALDALKEYVGVVVSVNDPNDWTPKVADAGEPARKAIEALRTRLAQPEPLPEKSKGALSHEENKRHNKKILDKFYEENAHLYTGEWVGLTNEEIDWLWGLAFKAKLENMPRHFARMVEENLKEKNT